MASQDPVPYVTSELYPLVKTRGLGDDNAPNRPLLGIVLRLTWQKGIDRIIDLAPDWLRAGAQLAGVGTGDEALQKALSAMAIRYAGQVGVHIGYDETFSHLMETGLELFLMPSRFEPCGLNQMYAMRYGTPPVVSRTGGLADTVVNERDGASATGFVSDDVALDHTVRHAIGVWRDNKRWRALQNNAVSQDFGWESPAAQHRELYQNLSAMGQR
jgi:starch synthase